MDSKAGIDVNDAASREMDHQASMNGWKPNPNHSDARYRERNESEIKSAAFRSKEGYCKDHSTKVKEEMNGMRMPEHMKRRR